MQVVHWHGDEMAVAIMVDVSHAELLLEGLERISPNIVTRCMKRELNAAIEAAANEVARPPTG